MTDEAQWKRRIARERNARKQAEALLESKSLELWKAGKRLKSLNLELEDRIRLRTHELEVARDAAEEASRAKSMFLASMSHEIRTPLNGVLGMNRLLLETNLDEEQEDFAQTMLSSAQKLLTLLNDILDLSKYQAGKLELEAIEFDLRDLVEDCCGLVAESTQSKGLELVGKIESGLSTSWIGDSGRLRQVILNFMTNAAKFTDQGEVTLRVARDEDDPTRIRFSVSDTGIGVPAEATDRLFQSFKQVDSTTTRKYGGTGLGLAISSFLAKEMGGQVGLESELGVGSTFWFTARLEPVPAITPDVVPLALPSATRILVLSSNQTLGAWLLDELSELGTAAQWVRDVPSCVDELRTLGEHDLLLVDSVAFSQEDFRELHSTPQAHSVAWIELVPTARLLRPDHGCRHRGSVELGKPIRRKALRRAIETALGLSASREPVPHTRDSWLATKANRVDGRRPRVLLVEDNVVNQKLALIILERLEVDVDLAVDGLEALRATSKFAFDLVLMDCQMPEMDGYEATSRIRQREFVKGGHLPIIAMTANAMPSDQQLCIDSGMDDYLAKPFQPADLLRLIDQWSAKARSRGRAS